MFLGSFYHAPEYIQFAKQDDLKRILNHFYHCKVKFTIDFIVIIFTYLCIMQSISTHIDTQRSFDIFINAVFKPV